MMPDIATRPAVRMTAGEAIEQVERQLAEHENLHAKALCEDDAAAAALHGIACAVLVDLLGRLRAAAKDGPE